MSALTTLGIETSCDETAAAIVRLENGRPTVLGEKIRGQVEAHAPWGGVVPEIAARAHAEIVDDVIAAAMAEAGLNFADLDGVAGTAGPGLIGGVMVGLVAAKAIALVHDKPLIAVNHLEGHALSPRLAAPFGFPYLLLLASGGHCQFIAVLGLGDYRRLGSTIDDALGEAFDKVAKLLGLGFPGGPEVERRAKTGDPNAFALPRPMLGRDGCDFSFAGLKTAVVREVEKQQGPLSAQVVADLCASFQAAAADVVEDRARHAMRAFDPMWGAKGRFAVAGGVAANGVLRARLERLAAENRYDFLAPPMKWCTDNGAMIALAGAERLAAGFSDGLDAPARPRWPLDEGAAQSRPTHRAGRKGVKA